MSYMRTGRRRRGRGGLGADAITGGTTGGILGGVQQPWYAGSILGTTAPKTTTTTKTTTSTGGKVADTLKSGLSALTSYFGAKQAEAQASAAMVAQPSSSGGSYLPIILIGGAVAVGAVFLMKRRK